MRSALRLPQWGPGGGGDGRQGDSEEFAVVNQVTANGLRTKLVTRGVVRRECEDIKGPS